MHSRKALTFVTFVRVILCIGLTFGTWPASVQAQTSGGATSVNLHGADDPAVGAIKAQALKTKMGFCDRKATEPEKEKCINEAIGLASGSALPNADACLKATTAVDTLAKQINKACSRGQTSGENCLAAAMTCKKQMNNVASSECKDIDPGSSATMALDSDEDDEDGDEDDPLGLSTKCDRLFPKACGASAQASYSYQEYKDSLKDLRTEKKDLETKVKDQREAVQKIQEELVKIQQQQQKAQAKLESDSRQLQTDLQNLLVQIQSEKLKTLQDANQKYLEIDTQMAGLRDQQRLQKFAIAKVVRTENVRCDNEAKTQFAQILAEHRKRREAGMNNCGNLSNLVNCPRSLRDNLKAAFNECINGQAAQQNVGVEQDKLKTTEASLGDKQALLERQRQTVYKLVSDVDNQAEIKQQQGQKQIVEQMQQLQKNFQLQQQEFAQNTQLTQQKLTEAQQEQQKTNQEIALNPYKIRCNEKRKSCAASRGGSQKRSNSSSEETRDMQSVASEIPSLTSLCSTAIRVCTKSGEAGDFNNDYCNFLVNKQTGQANYKDSEKLEEELLSKYEAISNPSSARSTRSSSSPRTPSGSTKATDRSATPATPANGAAVTPATPISPANPANNAPVSGASNTSAPAAAPVNGGAPVQTQAAAVRSTRPNGAPINNAALINNYNNQRNNRRPSAASKNAVRSSQ